MLNGCWNNSDFVIFNNLDGACQYYVVSLYFLVTYKIRSPIPCSPVVVNCLLPAPAHATLPTVPLVHSCSDSFGVWGELSPGARSELLGIMSHPLWRTYSLFSSPPENHWCGIQKDSWGANRSILIVNQFVNFRFFPVVWVHPLLAVEDLPWKCNLFKIFKRSIKL